MPSISANGIRFHYEFHGPNDAPVVTFSHALGASTAMWREQVALLSGDYRCLAYDANGHGGSTERLGDFSIASLADDLAALLGALDIRRTHLVGASLGGMTAMSFATRHPALLDRLALVGTTAQMPDAAPWHERAAKVRADGLDDLADATMGRWFTDGFAAANRARVEETKAAFLATHVGAYAQACEAIAAMDLTDDIRRIAAPTLVMAAENDAATTPQMADDIADRVPGAALVMIPEAKHMMAIERPELVAAGIRTHFEVDQY